MRKAATSRPAWANAIKRGDMLTVRSEFMGRGGQQGEVLSADDEGVSLDFFCDRNGDPDGVPSQEFWEWSEIAPDLLPVHIQQAT